MASARSSGTGEDRAARRKRGTVRTLRYSTKRARNAVKCSARRMLPGTASCSRSCGSTAGERGRASGDGRLTTESSGTDAPGFDMKSSSSAPSSPACRPSTSRRYSSSRTEASLAFILRDSTRLVRGCAQSGSKRRKGRASDALLNRLAELVDASCRRVEHGPGEVDRERLDADVVCEQAVRASAGSTSSSTSQARQTARGGGASVDAGADAPMLCASSKTTIESLLICFETCSATFGSSK